MDPTTAKARALAILPPLLWDTEVLMGFQAEGIVRGTGGRHLTSVRPITNELVGGDVTGGTLSLGMVVRAVWRRVLRGDPSEVDTVPLSRAQRRRAERVGATTGPVQVLHAPIDSDRASSPDQNGDGAGAP